MEPKKNPSKDVHLYTKHFFLIGFALSVVLVIVAFEWKSRVPKKSVNDLPHERDITYYPYEVIPVKLENPLPEKPKKVKLVNPNRIVEADNLNEQTIDEPLAIELPEANTTGEIKIDIPVEVPVDTFMVVEKMPLPIGGYEAFYKQLGKTIKYPNRAKQQHVQGKVFVEFVVSPSGEPINLKIVKGIGGGCDEEAIRALKLIRWEPGKQRGNPVFVKMTLPVYFQLN